MDSTTFGNLLWQFGVLMLGVGVLVKAMTSGYGHLISEQGKRIAALEVRVEECDKFHVAIKNAAAHALGLACSLRCVVEEDLQTNRLVEIRTDPPLPALPLKMLIAPGATSKRPLDELCELLKNGLSQIQSGN